MSRRPSHSDESDSGGGFFDGWNQRSSKPKNNPKPANKEKKWASLLRARGIGGQVQNVIRKNAPVRRVDGSLTPYMTPTDDTNNNNDGGEENDWGGPSGSQPHQPQQQHEKDLSQGSSPSAENNRVRDHHVSWDNHHEPTMQNSTPHETINNYHPNNTVADHEYSRSLPHQDAPDNVYEGEQKIHNKERQPPPLPPVWEQQVSSSPNLPQTPRTTTQGDQKDESQENIILVKRRSTITSNVSSLSSGTGSIVSESSGSSSKNDGAADEGDDHIQNDIERPKSPPSTLPNLHKDLDRSKWSDFAQHLDFLSMHPDICYRTVTETDPKDSSIPLHKAVWKAPPSLTLFLIELLPASKELSGIYLHKDKDNNTALHLCAGNLPHKHHPPKENNNTTTDPPPPIIDTSVLEALVRAAPRALQLQNSEGDTPLHLLVSSPEASIPNSGIEKAVAILLENDRDACILQDHTGATPLHTALANHASDDILKELIAAAPMACASEDSRGMLPLHYVAAFAKTSVSVVKKMVKAYPEGVCHHSVNGDAPLHLAISNATSSCVRNGKVEKGFLKVVDLLLMERKGREADENSTMQSSMTSMQCPILMTNREKLTPLHCCALFEAPPQLTKLLMKHPSSDQSASMTNSFGATPLHLAAAQPGVAQSIATVLSLGTPNAASIQDRLKRTPLHVAAQNIHSTDVLIQALHKLNPDATATKTQRGHLPLHLAAQSQAKESVVMALLKAYPEGAEARNKSGNTPLHDAAKYRASAGVVRLLVETFKDAVYVQNQYGNLPLHCATAYQAAGDVVQLLLRAWPEAASMQNRNQDTPLHYAAAYATKIEAVKPLIDAAPASVLLLNASGQSPIDRAKANNAPDNVIRLLEMSSTEWTQQAQSDGWGFAPDS